MLVLKLNHVVKGIAAGKRHSGSRLDDCSRDDSHDTPQYGQSMHCTQFDNMDQTFNLLPQNGLKRM